MSVKDGENAVNVGIDSEYASFDFRLTGFTEKHLKTEFVMCAYSYDGNSIDYLTSTANKKPLTVTCEQFLK